MKPRLILPAVLFFWTGYLPAQPAGQPGLDTAYQPVKLAKEIKAGKIFVYDGLRPAVIYLGFDEIRALCEKKSKGENGAGEYQYILSRFDKEAAGRDTVPAGEDINEVNTLVSELMIAGKAMVFDHHRNRYSDSVYHRLERYGTEAWRFFYLPDQKPFFAVMEWSAIIDENETLMKTMGKNPGEYKLLADKLKKIWKQ